MGVTGLLVRAGAARPHVLVAAMPGGAAMRLAAELWAQARNTGRPTASDADLDADVILAAQALTLGVADVVVATTNPGHIARFVPAEFWQNITP